MVVFILSYSVLFLVALLHVGEANNVDTFNFRFRDERSPGGGTDYGQQNWGDVTCDDLRYCEGYQNKFLSGIGFSIGSGGNKCRWCVEGGPENCGLHRQSPIDLHRDRAIPGHRNEKECPDWHYMMYRDDTCDWSDMVDQFEIARHALKINIPIQSNGDIDCVRESDGFRQFPRLDYSKGFPDWWWLDHIEITVPSSHTQEGKRYAAEVILAHFYQIEHEKNQLGHVSLFLQDYPDAEPWPYLDKLICQWRKEEERVRSSCGLDPAPSYGRCSLFRGQEPADDSFAETGSEATEEPADDWFDETETEVTEEPAPSPPAFEEPEESQESNNPWENWGFRIDGVAPSPGRPTRRQPRPTPAGPPPPVNPPPVNPPPVLPPRPTEAPAAVDDFEATGTDNQESPPIDCSRYSQANFDRMCDSSDPCCESSRSDTDFCWNNYENVFPGNMIVSACRDCCPNGGKQIGPANPEKPGVPKTIQCSTVSNPHRICKPNSCCVNPRSTTGFCRGIYSLYGDDMEQLCHYCCSEPQEIGPEFRYLRAGEGDLSEGNATSAVDLLSSDVYSPASLEEKAEDHIPEGAKVTHAYGRKLLLRKENFVDDEEDEQEYFDRIYSDFKHRSMQEVHEVDYDDVMWWPYEWLLKVGTEYYFRYEGTEMVPPCWEVVHWRVMKDPIRVHKRQIDELNRLLAWRKSSSGSNRCQDETAGDVSSDGQTVDLSRRTQYYHTQHRKVFCECKDWPSKFEGDKEWCRNWQNDPGYERFYQTPYSFDTNGDW